MKEEGRGGGSELGSDLDLDPWKILWIRIRQNDADPRILWIRIHNNDSPAVLKVRSHASHGESAADSIDNNLAVLRSKLADLDFKFKLAISN